ncbi:hypothetical protein A3860_32355 [Niastella vici]|uniref:Ig-like domain-containing protein n=1 Tax=Niastella vici TaxID=1703345 RepID=A0A1V9FQR8_9BACT|nr:T9SS type B sorting domain-containing protein [Niastella vici]OQP60693.1 hypothetical protein A3860_32355 [Niastella vici]
MTQKLILLPIFIASYLFSVAQLQPADTCLDSYFRRLYMFRQNDHLSSITETSDKNLLWCGTATATNTSNATDGDAVIVRLRNNGTIIWSKFIGGAYFDQFNRARENRDKSIIAVGTTNNSIYAARNMFISKLDSAGNLLWAKTIYDANTNNPAMEAMDVAETNDGGYFICGTAFSGNVGGGDAVLLKIDANGNLIWFKQLAMANINGPSTASNFVLNNDTAYVTGWYHDIFHRDGLLMKIDANTGAIYWSKHYDYQKNDFYTGNLRSTNNIFKSIFILNGQLRINMISEINGPLEAWMINMDLDGNVLKTRKLLTPAPENLGHITTEYPTADDGFISAGNQFYNNSYIFRLVKVDADGNLAWSKSYAQPNGPHPYSTFINSNNDIFVAGFEAIGLPSLHFPAFLSKTDKDGNIPGGNCLNYPFPATVSSGDLSTVNLTWERVNNFTPTNIFVNSAISNAVPVLTDECSTVFSCDQLKIIQTVNSFCDLKDTIQYAVQRSPGCNRPATWIADTAIIKITETTDSTVRLLFRKAGTAKLFARMISACKILEDSVTITAFESPGLVDLGPDIGICKKSKLTLSAGSGFRSYQWNNGSTDSTLTVFNPGKYFVQAEDYCSNIFKDTIQVTAVPDIPFDLGPDLEKCNNDTLNIVAPGSFLLYTWSPVYAISSPSGSTVQVWPASDTSYSVIAEVGRGCTVFDTVRITVKNSPPVYLGNDTSLCAGNSILLKASAGFNSYSWHDGTTGQTYLANHKGFYQVLATYNNGCVSKDTLEIKNVFPLPVVDLGKDIDICANETHTFNAGNGFRSWLWQDGSGQSTYNANKPGLYWVQVNDLNNCTNSDTVAITGLKPAPENFAAADTGICPGRPLELKALGIWSSYLWSNNAQAPAITIIEPGEYWLEVTNVAGCVARDTIRVATNDCKKGVYFANAFTPNNDGRNDTYRPVVQGLLDKFKLIIYNRYGEKIFETTNYLHGWNGLYNGRLQDSNQYVWLCYYRFRGEKEKVERGTLLLLR